MSGGHFDYVQYQINEAAEELGKIIQDAESNDGDKRYHYSKETLDIFKRAAAQLAMAGCALHRIDWLVCCDDGEDTFHERIAKDITKLAEENPYVKEAFEEYTKDM